METAAVIEPHYLPCLAYFAALEGRGRIVVDKNEHYRKQSYRNRCYLLGPHKIETLIVPVRGARQLTPLSEVRIDHDQKWLNNHWRTIRTAYGKAPFFEHYAPDLHDILFKRHELLADLTVETVAMCLKWLKMAVSLETPAGYPAVPSGGIVDLRGAINPKKADGCNRYYKSVEYRQVFGSKFVPNLSIIDLVFCLGPGAREIIRSSVLK